MLKKLVLLLLRAYKLYVSPIMVSLFGSACIYKITCSEYAIDMIKDKGVITGTILAFRRFLTCSTLEFSQEKI